MTVKARHRGVPHFTDAVRSFSAAVINAKARTEHLARPAAADVQQADVLREALEELRVHQEELAVADEEMRAQIDELAHANARVHAERDRYHELFELAPDAYFVTDRVGAIRDGNGRAAATVNLDPKFLPGKPLAALIDAADTRAFRDSLSALRTAETVELVVRFVPRGGEPTWHSLKGTNIEHGNAVLWSARNIHKDREASAVLVSANDDLAARVAARTAELERANRDKDEVLARERRLRVQLEEEHAAKDRFLAVLSHDLRAPLNAVLGWTQLLRREKLDQVARDRALATVERNARAQLRLVEELLDISRIAADKVQLERVPIDLAELVQPAVDAVAIEAQERGIAVRVVRPPSAERLIVAGDRRRLGQVMTNLVSNAMKFTPAGGAITLTLERHDSRARVSVEDTGRGIAPELLPHVFDAFRQASDYTTAHEGLGLGLYIVRQAVEMLGGTVVAESAGVGRGARFVVDLPAIQGSTAAAPSIATLPSSGRLEGVRVLVVDDEEDARELMATILRQRGAIVTAAGDVESALHAFETSQPDVVVSDVAMPGRGGLDLVRVLRAKGTSATLVAVSGFVSADEVEAALDAGFDLHVSKPVEPGELIEAVGDAARARAH
jgi:PAS domain S-box-containing protein